VLALSGFGLFLVSGAADLYGAAGAGHASPASRPTARVELALGLASVTDPQFDHRPFGTLGGALRLGRGELAGDLWQELDGDTRRLRLTGAWQLLGRPPAAAPPTSSRLDATLTFFRYRFPDSRFTSTSGEAALVGRLDGAAFAPSLAGSFAAGTVGWGLQAFTYDVPGATTDLDELLLLRFGYGVVLGRAEGVQAEVLLSYDHRRDGFAGASSAGSGILGHLDLTARLDGPDGWGLQGQAQLGSAWVFALALTRQLGGRP